ncbi:hypothetical protein [Haloferax sp. DFSO60]|uniref:hypothetical protein n=1 Tax=Haloferax sp. DFSO60 TaxID=3388652 RepID=UPI00397AA2FE
MVDGVLLDGSELKGKVKGGRAGAMIAGKKYVGYELGIAAGCIHIYGNDCSSDIRDEEFRYLVIPFDSIQGLELKDLTDRGRAIEIHAIGETVTLYSENQSRLSENLKRAFVLVSKLL